MTLHAPAVNPDAVGTIECADGDVFVDWLFRQSCQLGDFEAAFLEHVQKIVRQVDVALIDLINQKGTRSSKANCSSAANWAT